MYDLNLRRSSSFWYERSLRTASYASIAILVLLSVAVISPVYIQSKLAEAAPGTPTASTLSFTGTNLVASATLTVNSPTGTFATSGENEKSSFSISTNNYTGYTLTLRSSGANTSLSDGNSHSISTLPASTTQAVFSSSGTNGQVLNNRWGYIPSYYNSVANTTTYYPAPTNVNTATLRATSSANSADGTSNADNYTIGLGFRADYNSPSGTYANDTFVLEYIANPVTYLISFDDNTGDSSVSGIPSTTLSGTTSTTSLALPSTIPTRTAHTFSGWCLGTVSDSGTTCTGTLFAAGADFGIDQTTPNVLTLYATWALDLLKIDFVGNGLYFGGDPSNTINTVIYDATITTTYYTDLYAHTDNFKDGNDEPTEYYYGEETITPVKISGANRLSVDLQYGITNDASDDYYDYLFVIDGEYTQDDFDAYSLYEYMYYCDQDRECAEEEILNDYGLTVLGIFTGSPDTGDFTDPSSTTINVAGDAVTFVFYGYAYDDAYGYYATIKGYDNGNNPIEMPGTTYSKTTAVGNYATPSSTAAHEFLGWSENANATTATYTNETEISSNIAAINGDPAITLYAIYKSGITIKYYANGGSGAMADQVIIAGQTAPLSTNTFVAPNATSSFVRWNTLSNGTGTPYSYSYYTVPNDIPLGSSLSVYAIWIDRANLTEMQNLSATNCSTAGTYVYDNRDNEVYLVRKLADGKCWLLDNLRLDLTNSSILNGINPSNTNANVNSITSLKSGNRAAGNNYATSGVTSFPSSNTTSYDIPYVETRYKDNLVKSTGDGSGKRGVYYNFCAATAGSYCYSATSGRTSYATEDICPVGWRMPTLTSASGEYRELAQYFATGPEYLNAFSASFSGYRMTGSVIYNVGNSGRFWASNWYSGSYMWNMEALTSNPTFGAVYGYSGESVRCILAPDVSLTISFTGSGISSVKICKVSGNCTGSDIVGTVSSSGGVVTGLKYKTAYYLYPIFSSNYEVKNWLNTGSYGTLSCVASNNCTTTLNPSFITGAMDGNVTIEGGEKKYYMQDFSSSTIADLLPSVGSVATVYDVRDETQYTIGKLADNKYWMLDNLALDLTDSSILNSVSSSNTNASTISITSLKNGNRSAGNQYATDGITSWTSSYSFSAPYVNAQYKDTATTSYGVGNGRIGVLYNYCAASAGSYCYGSGTSYGSSSNNASEDICPKGWHIPTGDTSSGSYYYLYNTGYGASITGFSTAFSATLSGAYHSRAPFSYGDSGNWWTSTRVDDQYMRRLYVSSTSVSPQAVLGRDYGLSVRCVFGN